MSQSSAAYPDANIIFGAAFDEDLEDEIRVTVIATGFEENQSILLRLVLARRTAHTHVGPASILHDSGDIRKVLINKAGDAPAPAVEPEGPKPAVNDDDWDILERIFSKKK